MFEEQNLPDSKVSVFHLQQVDPRLRTKKGLRDKVAVSLPLGSKEAYVLWRQRGWRWWMGWRTERLFLCGPQTHDKAT